MADCLFCSIIAGEIPSKKVYEDEWVYAFEDISPVAPHHVLLIPKEHIASVNEITAENSATVAKIYEAAGEIAQQLGIAQDGYRIVTNCGEKAGQTVFHLHFHLIAGRDLQWPPG
ncbi:MAG: histidine triad nucleotide-binding protein [Clostridia bacterium]|nr:histidine triad nucleotide-binding protein [Clostridia bacterium]